MFVVATQALPLQVPVERVPNPALQDAVPAVQALPAGTCVHSPVPSQVPVLPQALAGHWPLGAVVPPAIGLQVPDLPGTLHDWQVPQDGPVMQQTLSTQFPLLHSWPLRQAVLFPLTGWQLPPVPVQ